MLKYCSGTFPDSLGQIMPSLFNIFFNFVKIKAIRITNICQHGAKLLQSRIQPCHAVRELSCSFHFKFLSFNF